MRQIVMLAILAAILALLLADVELQAFTSPVSPLIPPSGVPTQHAEFYAWCTGMCRVEAPGNAGCLRYCRRTALAECQAQAGGNCNELYGEPKVQVQRRQAVTPGFISKAR